MFWVYIFIYKLYKCYVELKILKVKKSLDFCFVKNIYDSEILFDIFERDDLDYEDIYKYLITRVWNFSWGWFK